MIESQSNFSSNKIETHSKVKRTIGYGLLLLLISEISFLLRVLSASVAAFKVGIASLSILSASALVSLILDAYSLTYLSSSETNCFTLFASEESIYNF